MNAPLVVRPSLRAAAERFLVLFSVLLGIALPLIITVLVRQYLDPEVDPWPMYAGPLASLQLGASILVPLLASLAPAVQIAFTRYVFDDEGIREKVQILSRSEKRVRWEKVTALLHRRTMLDRLLGIERLDIVAYGERGTTLHLVGLREARPLRALVAQQMRRQATVRHLMAND